MVNICVPVLRRYDCLLELVASLEKSTIKPDGVHIIDSGRNMQKMVPVLQKLVTIGIKSDVFTPNQQMGVAESWNWFIRNVGPERIICNDDVTFAPGSIQKMVETPGEMVMAGECGYSCYLLRDSCIEKVGLFDEEISPGYGYFEDEDYATRMLQLGLRHVAVPTGMIHRKSSTLLAYTSLEVEAHHRRFLIAKTNYMRKWGATPTVVKEEILAGKRVLEIVGAPRGQRETL